MNAIGSATQSATISQPRTSTKNDTELRKTFDEFVNQTFYGQMLKSMRKSVGKPAYFHGGRGEEIFSEQLDQVLCKKIGESSGGSLSDAMYELFTLGRK